MALRDRRLSSGINQTITFDSPGYRRRPKYLWRIWVPLTVAALVIVAGLTAVWVALN